ncbi:hypothetical protein [Acrocarpospora corrugata]|nr:hypothetical protein [Acrocarpospora corrugata]
MTWSRPSGAGPPSLLQEKGVFRADYTGPTLRDHLGLTKEPS